MYVCCVDMSRTSVAVAVRLGLLLGRVFRDGPLITCGQGPILHGQFFSEFSDFQVLHLGPRFLLGVQGRADGSSVLMVNVNNDTVFIDEDISKLVLAITRPDLTPA